MVEIKIHTNKNIMSQKKDVQYYVHILGTPYKGKILMVASSPTSVY